MKSTASLFFGLVVAAVLTVAALACGLVLGSKPLAFADLQHYFSDGPRIYNDWVIDSRLPRTFAVACCGGALGLSGALMQGLTRNPLADPGLLGVNAGAAAAIVSALWIPFLQNISEFWLALSGSLVVSALICGIGLSSRRGSYGKLVLAGAAVGAALSAYVSAISQLNPILFDYLRFWNSGSFGGVTLQTIGDMLPFAVPAAIVALLLGYHLNLIALGTETVRSLGTRVLPVQLAVLVCAAVLAGSSVAVAGPVAFVGLAAAHIARMWTGNDYRWLLPYSLFIGIVLLVFSDILARIVLSPTEIATGIITALAGAPLLYIVALRSKGANK